MALPMVRFRKTAPSSSIYATLAPTSVSVVVARLCPICVAMNLPPILVKAPMSGMAVTIIVCYSLTAFGALMMFS